MTTDKSIKRRRTLAVRLGYSVSHAAVIGDVARTLGIDVVSSDGVVNETVVGDVILPLDAPRWMIEAAVLRSLAPKHILFLCVANSARSQMAEGIARSMASEGVRISSAGSAPTAPHRQAIKALSELGLDISGHTSSDAISVEGTVDAVITLCAEEVCPVWLEPAWRLHWGLPDPAHSGDIPDQEVTAFRAVRDELIRRLTVLFLGTCE